MVPMMTTRSAAYAVVLAIASIPLILASPAAAERCGPAGNLVPGLICSPAQAKPTATATPSAIPPSVPSTPSPAVTGTAQPPGAPGRAVPAAPVGSTDAGPSGDSTAEVVPAQTEATATDPGAMPGPSSPAPDSPLPPEADKGRALAPHGAEHGESNDTVGAFLLALGGLLVGWWAAARLRGPR